MVTALPILFFVAQAEPAPNPTPAPTIEREKPTLPASAVGFAVGLAYRLPLSGEDVPPALGPTLATFIGHRYALLSHTLALGMSASFTYSRHLSADTGISLFDFALLQTAVLEVGRVRPWAAFGGGVSLGHFTSPEPRYEPGESRAVVAVMQAGVGADVNVYGPTDVGLRLEYAHLFPQPSFQTHAGAKLGVFGPRFAARLGIQYRF